MHSTTEESCLCIHNYCNRASVHTYTTKCVPEHTTTKCFPEHMTTETRCPHTQTDHTSVASLYTNNPSLYTNIPVSPNSFFGSLSPGSNREFSVSQYTHSQSATERSFYFDTVCKMLNSQNSTSFLRIYQD